VRIMAYDPRRPHSERYVESAAPVLRTLLKRIRMDSIKLCHALGYDFNSVEFAVERGTPYAIDFMNPVPDADIHSIGQANFDWIVKEVADLAIAKAKTAPHAPRLRSAEFLGSEPVSANLEKKTKLARKTQSTSRATEGLNKKP